MKNWKINPILLITLIGVLSVSCKKDEDDTLDPKPITEETYTIPSTYVFTDNNGNNTVDYSGQTQRLNMLEEMVSMMKLANTAGVEVLATDLKMMYDNSYTGWVDSDLLGLVGSSKQLKDKTAMGDVGVQGLIESYMDSLSHISSLTVTDSNLGSEGVAGVWPADNAGGPYLMSGSGIEYTQLIEKGLMCAVFMSQMTVNYLEEVKTDDNTSRDSAKHYTEMEHHWDEAFGYFTSEIDYPDNASQRFWGKYAAGRESVLGSSTKLMDAFLKGRAAISNEDYTTRDEQIVIIRNEIELVAAGTAIHYLNEAISNLANQTKRNHELSEAYAFINGLRYGYNAINSVHITTAEIDEALGYLGTDFVNLSNSDIQIVIDFIAEKTDLSDVKGEL